MPSSQPFGFSANPYARLSALGCQGVLGGEKGTMLGWIMGEERVRAIHDAAPYEERDLVAIKRRLQPVPVTIGEIRLALVTRPAKPQASA